MIFSLIKCGLNYHKSHSVDMKLQHISAEFLAYFAFFVKNCCLKKKTQHFLFIESGLKALLWTSKVSISQGPLERDSYLVVS